MRTVVVGISLLAMIASIYAGPPFVRDDPEPPPPGGWEINVPFVLERTPGTTEMDAPGDAACADHKCFPC